MRAVFYELVIFIALTMLMALIVLSASQFALEFFLFVQE